MIYLASPYSHPLSSVREDRFKRVSIVAARLLKEGKIVYSPIAHTHPIAVYGELPNGWEFWEKIDRAFMQRCDSLVVVKMPGWEISRGVLAEIRMAHELGLMVEYIDE